MMFITPNCFDYTYNYLSRTPKLSLIYEFSFSFMTQSNVLVHMVSKATSYVQLHLGPCHPREILMHFSDKVFNLHKMHNLTWCPILDFGAVCQNNLEHYYMTLNRLEVELLKVVGQGTFEII